MSQFFRIGLAMAIIVCMISGPGAIPRKALGTYAAVKSGKDGGGDSDSAPTSTPAEPTSAGPASAGAPTGPTSAGTQKTARVVAAPLTKMEIIIKKVTSQKYPYRCSAFAGDYCNRQYTVICAPPL